MQGYLMNKTANSRGQVLFALLMVPLLISLPALADPPPGTPDVTNNFCSTWNNGTGICDDYNFAHDLTSATDWVNSKYEFEMHNTSKITLTLEWEMHEFNRSAIGLEDMDLGAGFDSNNSGAPVDYIRNYLGYTTPQGIQVRQMILNEFSSAVEELVNNAYNGTADVQSSIVDEVNIGGQNIQCSDDMNADSIDEVLGLDNNAFQPPLCLQSVAEIEIGEGLFNISENPINLERAFQGLLTMGASVSTDFTLVSSPGHYSTFELIPPNYVTFSEISGNGVLVPHQQGSFQYNTARWVTDGYNEQSGGINYSDVSITSIYRNTTTNSVMLDIANDQGLTINMLADLRDGENSVVSAEIDIHYFPQSVLEDWGFSLGNGIEIPWITSDGIRMAHEYGLLNIDDFSHMLPLEDVETAILDVTDTEIILNDLTWKEPDLSGGLNFSHTPTQTCSELVVVTHCLTGANAMNATFPVTLISSSEPFPASPLEFVTDRLRDQPGFENITEITEQDVSALLSILSYEYEFDTDFITDSLPDWLPPTEIEMTILLPDWIESDLGNHDRITIHASSQQSNEQTIAITGPNPYYQRWNDPICDGGGACSDASANLICSSSEKTCININAQLDFPSFEIHEWSQEIELEVEGKISIEVYRLAFPDLLTEDYGLTIEAIPSDLIRHVIAYGDEQEGGLNGLFGETIPIELGENTHYLELSNLGLERFANSLSASLNEELSNLKQSEDEFTVDPSGLHFSAYVDYMERPYDGIIDDDEPLRFTLALDKTVISAGYDSGSVNIDTTKGHGVIPSFFNALLSAFDIRGSSDSDGVVTLPPEPYVVEVEPVIIVEDIDENHDTNNDGDLNNDQDLDVRPSIVFELSLPPGLEVEISSSLGRAEQYMIDGDRKKIIYRVPHCSEENPDDCDDQVDEVSLQFTIGYAFILQELMPYIIGLLVIIFLLFYMRSRRKKRKKEKQEIQQIQKRAVSINTYAVERDLLGLDSTPSGGGELDWMAGLDFDDDF